MKKYLPLLLLMVGISSYVSAQNQAPTAQFDFYPGIEDFPVFMNPTSNDTDPENDNLTIEVLLGPFKGQVTPLFGNNLIYDNDQNTNGIDAFFYRVCDDGNPSECSTPMLVLLYIAPINDAPSAINDSFTVPENITSLLDVLANDFDIDGDQLELRSIVQAPQHGTAVINNGQVAYLAAQGYTGTTDQFRYRACDPSNGCDNATVYITIIPENDAPIANEDSFINPANNATLDVLANDSDEEGDQITITSVTPIASSNILGNAIFDPASQTVTYDVINEGFCGTDSFQYVICDYEKCDTGIFRISVPCDAVFLPEGFSPDGDGINDHLVFSSLNRAIPATLRVYNRYGDIVYENADYHNDWDGTWQDHNESIPDGTYFYTVELSNGGKFINYLVVNR
jgi:gliding motility-associated-like protein